MHGWDTWKKYAYGNDYNNDDPIRVSLKCEISEISYITDDNIIKSLGYEKSPIAKIRAVIADDEVKPSHNDIHEGIIKITAYTDNLVREPDKEKNYIIAGNMKITRTLQTDGRTTYCHQYILADCIMPAPRTMKEVVELTRKAFDKNEVKELLTGQKEEYVFVSKVANIPTDFDYVVRICLYKYFEEINNEHYFYAQLAKLEKALRELLQSANPVDIWCAFMVGHSLYYYENQNKSSFKIMTEKFIKDFSTLLKINKEKLMECKCYEGKNKENGLWDEIERINKVYSKEGVNLL